MGPYRPYSCYTDRIRYASHFSFLLPDQKKGQINDNVSQAERQDSGPVMKWGGWEQHEKSTEMPYDIVVRWKLHAEATEWPNDRVS